MARHATAAAQFLVAGDLIALDTPVGRAVAVAVYGHGARVGDFIALNAAIVHVVPEHRARVVA